MPIEKPTPELLEQIRRNGRSDDCRVIAKWGYRRDGHRIFLLVDGEPLPDGWFASPAPEDWNLPETFPEASPSLPKRRGRPPKVLTSG